MDIAGSGKWSRTRAERYRKVRREEDEEVAEEKVAEDEAEIGGFELAGTEAGRDGRASTVNIHAEIPRRIRTCCD